MSSKNILANSALNAASGLAQLLTGFACSIVAARLLGTRPDMDEGEELLNEIPFKRFWSEAAKEQSEREQAEFNDDSLDDFAVEDFIEEEDDDGKGGKRS